VDLLLVDPKAQNRSTLRHTLNDLDFCEIRFGSSIADILRAIDTRIPDLVITDSELQDGDICKLIKGIRCNQIGPNPFLPVIVITWNPSNELVTKVINSGADDLLVQPISRSQLRDRINVLTFNRKPFVVTATYIGPDRRQQPRTDRQEVPLLEVPNSLNAKATGMLDVTQMQRAVDDMIEHFNQHKLERDAFHIDYLVNQILPAYQRNQIDTSLRRNLHELVLTTQDSLHRVAGTKYEYISKLCKAMISVVSRLGKQPQKPAEKDLKLLPELASAIRIAFEDGQSAAAAAQDISAEVERTGTA
jgi:DNA-binding response OmpR family regulator